MVELGKRSWELIRKTQSGESDVSGYSHMMLRISEFRTGLTKVATYGHIPVPLVYTQVNVITDLILPNLNLNLKG